MVYLYVKALHIIFVITWMAGLFYIVRLFIYHAEARQRPEGEYTLLHRQFVVMERRLWWAITTPSMYLAVAAGLTMLYLSPALLKAGWMHVKLVFVLGLIVYHFLCQYILRGMREETNRWTSIRLRMWNELPTVILFAIVFTVVLKSAISWIYGTVGLVLLSVMLMVAIRWYKKIRER